LPGRKRRARCIGFAPGLLCFKPCGRSARGLETLSLRSDELEALRLADLKGLYQEQCARRMGFNLLLYDARNHGSSDGDTFSSLPRFAEDLAMAIAWLKHHQPRQATHIAVLGHSVGDARRLMASCRAPQARLLEIDGAGHDATDQIERHVGSLLKFLDEQCSSRRNSSSDISLTAPATAAANAPAEP